MFRRGDLVLDRNPRLNDWDVYFLVDASVPESDTVAYWWAHNLGPLNNKCGWNKDLITYVKLVKRYCLRLTLESLSEEKQKTYQEFKTNYLDKDLV